MHVSFLPAAHCSVNERRLRGQLCDGRRWNVTIHCALSWRIDQSGAKIRSRLHNTVSYTFVQLDTAVRIQCERVFSQAFILFILRPYQHDDGYIDGRSQQMKVHNDERTRVHSARSSLTVTHPSTNRRSTLLNIGERATELTLVVAVSHVRVDYSRRQ